jgi:hypothetical protein
MQRVSRLLTSCAALLALAACGGPGSTSPTATATARASSTPSPTPTPAPPETQRIDIVASGVGAYQLATVPVAVIHNAATRSAATGVIVHLTPTLGGAGLTPLKTSALIVYPGETVAVAANCTDTCNNADGVSVVVEPGTWTQLVGGPPTATAAAYACVSGCSGHGQGDVRATVTGSGLLAGGRVDVFAACRAADGTIVGGGQRSVVWPQAGGSLPLTVPVIVSAQPATCEVDASVAA